MMDNIETSLGASDEWYTPPEIFSALNINFDLDPCAPQNGSHVPAEHYYIKQDDGLIMPWFRTVLMNLPFGGRHGHVPWLKQFIEHGDGVAIVRAYTSAGWFHDWAIKAETMCFPRGKTKFHRPDGSIGKSPGHGIVLLGMGKKANKAVLECNLGLSFKTGEKC